MKKIFMSLICIVFIFGIFNRKKLEMPDFYNKNINDFIAFANKNKLNYEIKNEYSDDIQIDKVIWQNIKPGEQLNNDILVVTKSVGKDLIKEYKKFKVDESGNVPIMMYHGISNLKNIDTGYTGGNVDKDGYIRTAESFRSDLDFYYNKGYRMIRLSDYIEGNINVELGKSPIILTFDDGLENNIKVTGLDESGNIIIDPNSAAGILEEYKKKYPDYNITATFFINGSLFRQDEYNSKILNWLINNGYDIGNHTYSHVDFTTIDKNRTSLEVGKMYKTLNEIIGDKYVSIVALPFGSPYDYNHSNFKYILSGDYNGFTYNTLSTLRVGWEADYSPFHKNFNPKFIKRIRSYDNNGNDFDITMNFNILNKNRYISDGNAYKIVVPKDKKDIMNENYNKEYIYY